MKKIITLIIALITSASHYAMGSGPISGAISYASDDYAAIYGTQLSAREVESWYATSGSFCGVSNLLAPIDFIWTGWITKAPARTSIPADGIWIFSCIRPAGPGEITLYSVTSLKNIMVRHVVKEDDDTLVEKLIDAMPDL